MKLYKPLKIIVAFAVVLLLAACATQPPEGLDSNPGFFSGLFHGFFSLFALIAGIFTDLIGAGGWGFTTWLLKA